MAERFKFTKTKVAGIALPLSGRLSYYDEIVPKLALRVTAAGSRSFYVIKRVGGEMVWLKLGTFPDMTVERAREDAEKALGEFASDSNPASIRRSRRKELTVAEFFDHEFNPRHLSKLRSGARRKRAFDTHVRPVIGKKKLSEVDRQTIARILSDMDAGSYAGGTVNQIRNIVSGMFSKAIEWGYCTSNPVAGIRGRKEGKRDRFVQGNELPRFFASLAAEENESLRDYLLISLLTGARRGNVVAMRWQDVRLDEGVWVIRRTKNDEPQNVTLSPEAIQILRAREGGHKIWVFPGRSKLGHLTEPKSGWKRILDRDELEQIRKRIQFEGGEFEWPILLPKANGQRGRRLEAVTCALERARETAARLKIDVTGTRLPDLRIHDLRRTLGSWQAKTGASLIIIGKSLNHKSPSATAIYARLDLDPVRQSVNTATAAMLEAGGMKATGEVVNIKKQGGA
jgi:integrase